MSTILTTLSDPARLAAVRATRLMDEPSAPMLDRLTALGALTLGVPVVAVTLLDEHRQFLASQVGLDPDDGLETPLSHSLCTHVVHTGDALVVEDALADPVLRENGAVRDLGVRAYAGLPLFVDGQVVGSFCSLDVAPRRWTAHELSVLAQLAALAADHLAFRVRGGGEATSDALDAWVLRRLPDTAVLRFDLDLRLTLAEGPALGARDRGAEGLVGRLIGDVLPADAWGAQASWYHAVAAGEHASFDFTTPAGDVWWCQGAPVLDDAGRPAGGTVVIRDVTEQREHEGVLEEREVQFRLLAERSTDVISRHDPTGRYLYASPAAAVVYGYDPAALVGRCATELIHPDDLAATGADLARLPSLEGSGTNTYRLIRADGTVIWVETTACVIRDEHGGVDEIQCSTRDITDRRAAEDARRAADALTDTLLDALQEGVVVHGADGLILACNASAERILGLSRDRLTGVSAFAPPWGMVDVGEREMLQGDRPVQRVLETREPHLGALVGLHRSDGRRVWLRVNAVPVRDDRGALAQVLVSLSDITDLREAEQRARHDADHDALTGLPNRAFLRRRLDVILGAPRRRAGSDVAVLFVDLDQFKVVNDSLGHRAGDDVLRAVASRLSGALRAGDMLARFGGDEFVVVAGDVQGREGAEQLADRLLAVLKEPLRAGDVEHVISASIGITVAVDRQVGGEALLRDADSAMYHAKQMGRSGFRLFESDMHERAVQRLSLERDLRRALAEDELELHYQPLWRTTPRILVGLEALVRWRHPERGLMSPGTFIPVAERSGLIVELGDWVLEAACRQIAAWGAAHPHAPPPVSVNLSARQLDDPRVAERLAALLGRHGVPAEALTLELTESHLMSRADRPDGGLSALRALGVRLALDDFGTGYSSLSQLRNLPLDSLKIDQSFIARICTDAADHAVVEAIVAMASALDLEVVAEGVETDEQVQLLTRMGCDVLQGFALGRPQPAACLEEVLRTARRAPRLQASRRAPPPRR